MSFGQTNPLRGLTPAQEDKLDLTNQKLDQVLNSFSELKQLLEQLEEMKKNNPELNGIYLELNKILQATRPLVEAIVKPGYEVLVDKVSKS